MGTKREEYINNETERKGKKVNEKETERQTRRNR